MAYKITTKENRLRQHQQHQPLLQPPQHQQQHQPPLQPQQHQQHQPQLQPQQHQQHQPQLQQQLQPQQHQQHQPPLQPQQHQQHQPPLQPQQHQQHQPQLQQQLQPQHQQQRQPPLQPQQHQQHHLPQEQRQQRQQRQQQQQRRQRQQRQQRRQVNATTVYSNGCSALNTTGLVACYSFDSGSAFDNGPNHLNGTLVGSVTTVSGHLNQALSFNSNASYFYTGGLVSLGTSNQPFSFSFWIKPISITGGTLVHVSIGQNGYNNGGVPWCAPFVGFNSAGYLIAQIIISGAVAAVTGPTISLNVWTHVAETYSTTNGVTLYINGTWFGSTGATGYTASGVTDYIHLAYYGTSGNTCQAASINGGQFMGAIDEFRVYSRELTSLEVSALANQ
ncbi:unnamed protein product [Adineta steineri]|uniref:LamG-like jellyroll fold domain-containing protein n=1 Tax=Adineta steineri TaxID=433720 RepID=A0A819U9P6_9BILA|nr:unnamed protein product [Adineta steineri]